MALDDLKQLTASLQTPEETRQRDIGRDFKEARQRADLQEVLARLKGQSNQLWSFDEIKRQLRLSGKVERGRQEIPLAAIVGSVGRYADFTRTFLPRQDSDQDRWVHVRSACIGPVPQNLPPIEVYKVGKAYFVLDGHHRVSVARERGLTHIEAYVTMVPTKVPLGLDLKPDELILKAEYASFLEATGLAETPDTLDLSLTAPAGYPQLAKQIEAYRRGSEQARGTAMPYRDAAQAWYSEVYHPIVAAIHERGLLRWFPGRTEADLLLWVTEHRQALEREFGWAIQPEAAMLDLAVKQNAHARALEAAPGSWRKTRLIQRYADRLFADILVPLDGTDESRQAMDQALVVAQREQAQLCGLHMASSESQRAGSATQELQVHFRQECAAAHVAGNLVIEIGDAPSKICERALLTDLVVLSAAHPPVAGLASLGSNIRRIIWNCARPLLVVTSRSTPLKQALLLYDGSPKAREALFVATYLADQWKTSLTVLALLDGAHVMPAVLDYPRAYLELHEIPAHFLVEQGSAEVFVRTAGELQADLVLLGGYSVSAVEEVVLGSAVNILLRQAVCPLFICH